MRCPAPPAPTSSGLEPASQVLAQGPIPVPVPASALGFTASILQVEFFSQFMRMFINRV